jgi:hypothetical protein
MLQAISHLNWIAVLVVTVIGFGLGAVWYSLLFGKAWAQEIKLTPEMMEAHRRRTGAVMSTAFLLNVLSTFTLAVLISAHHVAGADKGAELGLLVGVGLVAARQGTNMLFESRSLRHFLIVAGYEVLMCTVQGAILGVWR